jgi:hypothetical protein
VVCLFQACVVFKRFLNLLICFMEELLDGSFEVARQFCHLISYEDLGQ